MKMHLAPPHGDVLPDQRWTRRSFGWREGEHDDCSEGDTGILNGLAVTMFQWLLMCTYTRKQGGEIETNRFGVILLERSIRCPT